MLSRVFADADRTLAETLRGLSLPSDPEALDSKSLLDRAERHGCSGVVADLIVGAKLDAALAKRVVARDIDYTAHLGMLRNVDRALAAAKLRSVALKGALLAQRLYPRPSARATSDIDLLVAEKDLDRAVSALRDAGYEASTEASEARFRAEHHHLHLHHPHALPLELHFHAYKGFGRVLPSEPLVARSVEAPGAFQSVRVLEGPDELVYLAVHAAAHRFVRLGWLFDMKLLVDRLTDDEIVIARERAASWGFERAVAFAGALLEDVFAVKRARGLVSARLGRMRRSVLTRVAREPSDPLARSFTRFVYTAALCDSFDAAARYARGSSRDHVRRIFNRSA